MDVWIFLFPFYVHFVIIRWQQTEQGVLDLFYPLHLCKSTRMTDFCNISHLLWLATLLTDARLLFGFQIQVLYMLIVVNVKTCFINGLMTLTCRVIDIDELALSSLCFPVI